MWQVNCSLKCEEKLCSKAFRVVLPFLQSPGWHVIMLSWCSTVMGRFGIPRCSPPTSFGVRRGIMGAETWPEKPETLAFSRDQCYSCYIWYASCDLCSVFIPDPLRGSIEPVASVFFFAVTIETEEVTTWAVFMYLDVSCMFKLRETSRVTSPRWWRTRMPQSRNSQGARNPGGFRWGVGQVLPSDVLYDQLATNLINATTLI